MLSLDLWLCSTVVYKMLMGSYCEISFSVNFCWTVWRNMKIWENFTERLFGGSHFKLIRCIGSVELGFRCWYWIVKLKSLKNSFVSLDIWHEAASKSPLQRLSSKYCQGLYWLDPKVKWIHIGFCRKYFNSFIFM